MSRLLCLSACLFLILPPLAHAQEGFAGDVTGGAGGRAVTARSAEEFKAFAALPEPLVISVDGMLATGSVNVTSNKTVLGIGPNSGFRGTIFIPAGVSNIILQNLNFTNPMNKKGKGGGDGVSIYGGRRVWIDHCTFVDCGDGCVDVSKGADWVTISWCKFHYTKQPKHRFTMLIIGPEKKKVKKKLHVTLHHNWWGEKCDQRMPAARKAEVHMYNNYFSCAGNEYATNARDDAEILSEANYYENVRNPFYGEKGSRLRENGNIYHDCSGKIDKGDKDVFKPPYPYRLDKARDVPKIVRAGAGAR